MATYQGSTRTNYFKVINENAFTKLIDLCGTDDPDGVSLWTNETQDGVKRYGFGCYGDISGIPIESAENSEGGCENEREDEYEDEDVEYDYDAFIKELQKLLPESEAVIITHTGHEKLRYLVGSITVVTRDEVEYQSLSDVALQTAREMLGNPHWTTKDSY